MSLIRKLIARRRASSGGGGTTGEAPYDLVYTPITSINDGNTVDVKVGTITAQGDPIPSFTITGEFAIRSENEVWFTGRSNYTTQTSYTPTVTASNGIKPDATLQLNIPVVQAGSYDGPVPNTVVASADWNGVTGNPMYGPYLSWHTESRAYPPAKVLTPSHDLQVNGSINGYAFEVTTVNPTKDQKSALGNSSSRIDEEYTRMELKVGGYPPPLDGHGGGKNKDYGFAGWSSGHHIPLNQPVVINYRIKIAKEWQVDTVVADKPIDRYTSLFEFKQDYTDTSGTLIRRDSTFRMRMMGMWGNFKIEGSTGFKKTLLDENGTKFSRIKRVDLTNIFDNQWHLFTIHAKFTNDKDANGNPLGFVKVYLDNVLIYEDDDPLKQGNCWDDEDKYGPYFKFGHYNSWWKGNDIDTGSEFHRHLVDFIRVGVPT